MVLGVGKGVLFREASLVRGVLIEEFHCTILCVRVCDVCCVSVVNVLCVV